jgi:archaemetzincin
VIRVVTVDEFDDKQLKKFCQVLYAAFGIGCEHSGLSPIPGDQHEPFDGYKLMESVKPGLAYADDKVLYLTSRKLKDRVVPSGTVPTLGCAKYGMDKAIMTTLGTQGLEEGIKHVGRHALHQVGHLWELHHCLDPRCSMYPTWTPSFPLGDAIFCNYCREKSERKIRLAKS